MLDRTGRSGTAVAFAVAGFLATTGGIAAAAANLHEIGTGVLLIVAGLILAGYGARAGRRFTTWAWSAGVVLGATLIINKVADSNAAAAGMAMIVVGAVIVVAGQLASGALREPDDIAPDVPHPPIGSGPAY